MDQSARLAWIFTGIGHLRRHSSRPEQAHFVAVAIEDNDRSPFRAVVLQCSNTPSVAVADGLHEIKILPATLERKRDLLRNWPSANHLQRYTLFDVGGVAVYCAQEVC